MLYLIYKNLPLCAQNVTVLIQIFILKYILQISLGQ